MRAIKLKIANLFFSEMLLLQVTCVIQIQRQGVNCVPLHHTRLSRFRGCARSKPQFLTDVQSLNLLRLTQVDVWMVCWLFNFEACVGNVIQQASQGELWASQTRQSHFVSFTFWQLTIVCLGQLTTFHSTFPTVRTQPNSTHSKTLRQWSKWSTKDEAQT